MLAATVEPVEIWAPQVADLLAAVGDVAFVAGGAARQIVMSGDAPAAEDIDVFLRERGSFDKAAAVLEALGYRRQKTSSFSVTYAPRDLVHELHVQLIKPYSDDWSLTYGTPRQVIEKFSFTTEMFAVEAGKATIGPSAIEDTKARRLVLQTITNPLWVSLRAMKYAAKDYYIAPADMRRILDAWMDRPQQRRSANGRI
jgi:hypothetical protein